MKVNVYKQARLAAAEKKPALSTVEKAHSSLYISREKLLMIEQTDPAKRRADPNPDEVVKMAEVYGAPQLCDYYCTHHCPIGQGHKPLIHNSLSEISTSLMSALYFLDNASDKIHQILQDSKVSDEEKKEFIQSLKILKDIAYSANCLDLWAQKQGLTD